MTDGLEIKHANKLRHRFVAGESHLNQTRFNYFLTTPKCDPDQLYG